MPHSGHIAVEGTPYWGNGYFKFAIIDENEKALWTHDNSQKIPPTDHMSLEVKNGFYSLYLGDESVTGMKALPASSLLSSERIFLRVWFSKSGEDFETVGVDLALGAAPFALVSETTRGGGLSMEQSVSDLEARLDALEAAMSNITAASIDPVLLAEMGYKKFPSREISGLTIKSAEMNEADFKNARIVSVSLTGGSFVNANFMNATLIDSNFSDGIFTTAMINDANLSETFMDSIDAYGASFSGSTGEGSSVTLADLSLSDFNNADFTDSNFSDSNFQGASMLNASFRNSDLSSANFSSTLSNSSDFSGSNLSSAVMVNGSFVGAKFHGCNLFGADLSGADLTNADLTGAQNFNPDDHTDTIFSSTILPDGSLRNN